MKTATVLAAIGLVLSASPPAAAQTFSHLNIDIEGNVVSLSGGERGSVRMSSDGVVIGRTTQTTISARENACGLHVGPSPETQAASFWTVDVTPIQVYASAVTFQLKWARRTDGRSAPSAAGDVRVTLRPGESLPVDSMAVITSNKMPGGVCDLKAHTLRVSVGFWPRSETDTRILNIELWLLEKLRDGTERSQTLALRGGINTAIPYIFEPVPLPTTEGTLQLFGMFTVTPVAKTYSVQLETWSRPVVPPASNSQHGSRVDSLRYLFGQRAQRVSSVLTLNPGEVVDVQLPRLADALLEQLKGSQFSIRIRIKPVS